MLEIKKMAYRLTGENKLLAYQLKEKGFIIDYKIKKDEILIWWHPIVLISCICPVLNYEYFQDYENINEIICRLAKMKNNKWTDFVRIVK